MCIASYDVSLFCFEPKTNLSFNTYLDFIIHLGIHPRNTGEKGAHDIYLMKKYHCPWKYLLTFFMGNFSSLYI